MARDPQRRFYLDGYGKKPQEYPWHYGVGKGIKSLASGITFAAEAVDAFGRQRVSQPYTLFDSQNRYEEDSNYDTLSASGGSKSYNIDDSTINLNTTTASGSKVVRQTFRSFPYQPGKSLLIIQTFAMSEFVSGNRQRVGYFNDDNGIYLERDENGVVNIVLRSSSSGSVVEIKVPQSSWNGDKLDGVAPSKRLLDLTKTQIFWIDIEWLGVGPVRAGFYCDGRPVVAHTFQNENVQTTTYMTTAILNVRYEIENVSATTSTSFLKQICSSVQSEGGYSALSRNYIANRSTAATGIGTASYLPIVSIRHATNREGSVLLINKFQFYPTSTDDFEVVLLKNPTLTGATFAGSIAGNSNVDVDTAATAISSIGTIVDMGYATSSNQSTSTTQITEPYNWELQVGSSISGTSDIFTLAVRTLSGTGTGTGFISLYDLTTN